MNCDDEIIVYLFKESSYRQRKFGTQKQMIQHVSKMKLRQLLFGLGIKLGQ